MEEAPRDSIGRSLASMEAVRPTERTDVLLIGGGVASARCARTLRRRRFDGSIVLVGAEATLPYNRPPLSKELLRDDLPDDLVLAEPGDWYARRAIDLRLGTRVVDLDGVERLATLDDGTTIAFDRCLLATGVEPRRLPIEGAHHALLLRTLADARAIRARAEQAPGGAPVTVIGGGFIGVEVASSLAALGLRPTILEMGTGLWGGQLGTHLGDWALARLREAGVAVRPGAPVTRLDATTAWTGGERLEHAFAVAGIGVEPRADLGRSAGLQIDDGVVTDADQRTANPRIWAAGDVARVDGRRVEHWHTAREGGERAALAMLGEAVPPARASWVFGEVAGHQLDVVGSAPAWDEVRRIGTDERFALTYESDGRVTQVAIVDAAIPVEQARALVESGAPYADFEATVREARTV